MICVFHICRVDHIEIKHHIIIIIIFRKIIIGWSPLDWVWLVRTEGEICKDELCTYSDV